jgi:hypothetical protein
VSKNKDLTKLINGLDSEEWIAGFMGPMAAASIEMALFAIIQKKGEALSTAEVGLIKFAMERSYGAATRRMEHVSMSSQEIAASQLEGLDPAALRQIASVNAPRQDH